MADRHSLEPPFTMRSFPYLDRLIKSQLIYVSV